MAGFDKLEFTDRVAESGGLLGFYRREGMRPAHAVDNHEAVGWLVKAIKK
jgi:hypothetical protein